MWRRRKVTGYLKEMVNEMENRNNFNLPPDDVNDLAADMSISEGTGSELPRLFLHGVRPACKQKDLLGGS